MLKTIDCLIEVYDKKLHDLAEIEKTDWVPYTFNIYAVSGVKQWFGTDDEMIACKETCVLYMAGDSFRINIPFEKLKELLKKYEKI